MLKAFHDPDDPESLRLGSEELRPRRTRQQRKKKANYYWGPHGWCDSEETGEVT
jgi:hypothetical protein